MGIHRVLSAERLAAETSPSRRQFHGMIRRMAIRETARSLWVMLGHEKVNEKPVAEPFTGIGIFARPPTGTRAEAIVASVSGAGHPAVIAVRDEDTRRVIAKAVELKADETVLYNSVVVVLCRATGQVEIRTPDGLVFPLALKSDVQEAVDKFNGHKHVCAGSGAPSGGPVGPDGATPVSMDDPTGTEWLLSG